MVHSLPFLNPTNFFCCCSSACTSPQIPWFAIKNIEAFCYFPTSSVECWLAEKFRREAVITIARRKISLKYALMFLYLHDFFKSKCYVLFMIGMIAVRFCFSSAVFLFHEQAFGFVVTSNGIFFQCHAVGISPNGEGRYYLQDSLSLMVTAWIACGKSQWLRDQVFRQVHICQLWNINYFTIDGYLFSF